MIGTHYRVVRLLGQGGMSNIYLCEDTHLFGKVWAMKEFTATYADPRRALERGFSITRLNGKIVRDTAGLRSGDVLETMLMRGTVRSEVREVETGEK